MIDNDLDRGFVQACREILDCVSRAHQMASDKESHHIIDWIWDEINRIKAERLKVHAFDEITQIIPKDDKEP